MSTAVTRALCAQVIIRKGRIGAEMHVIKQGAVEVYLLLPSDAKPGAFDEKQLATLGDGAFFGEGARLVHQPPPTTTATTTTTHPTIPTTPCRPGALIPGGARRGAFIRALTHSLIYSLSAKSVAAVLENYPAVRGCIDQIAAERRAQTQKQQAELFARRSSASVDADEAKGEGGGSRSCSICNADVMAALSRAAKAQEAVATSIAVQRYSTHQSQHAAPAAAEPPTEAKKNWQRTRGMMKRVSMKQEAEDLPRGM